MPSCFFLKKTRWVKKDNSFQRLGWKRKLFLVCSFFYFLSDICLATDWFLATPVKFVSFLSGKQSFLVQKKEILEKTKEWTAREKKNSFSFAFKESISKKRKREILLKVLPFLLLTATRFFLRKKKEGKRTSSSCFWQYYWDLSLLPSKENYQNVFVQIVIFGNFQNFAEHFLPSFEISKMAWFFSKKHLEKVRTPNFPKNIYKQYNDIKETFFPILKTEQKVKNDERIPFLVSTLEEGGITHNILKFFFWGSVPSLYCTKIFSIIDNA